MYHWPDGIFLKNIVDINKIPGRDIIRKIKIPSNINRIHIIGNLSKISKNYLKKI